MKKSILAMTLGTLISFVGAVHAGDAAKVQATIIHHLKDGGTLYIFSDGKMAKESKYGVAVYLKRGEILETVDGKRLTANSNEVARLGNLLSEGHQD